ncbi:MAG: hypothetical protein ACOX8Q_05225 [Christensenellales bacterium]
MKCHYKIHANEDIRSLLKEKSIPFWRLAVALGVSEQTIIRRLRIELPPDEKAKICAIIKGQETEATL